MKAILAFAIISVLFAIASAQSVGAGSGALSISNLVITPNPVVAGSNVQVSFQLYNSYQYSLQNVNLYLEAPYPLLNYSPVSIAQISSIGQGLYGGLGYYLTYNLTLPKNIPSGVYTMQLYATYQTTQTTSTGAYSNSEPVTAYSVMPITLHVIGEPSISVSGSASSITPGEPFLLNLNVQNNGYDTAKNITISIAPTSSFKPIGTSTFSIGMLPIGSSLTLPISMFASTSIENETYLIPLSISYYSELGKEYFENTSISMSPLIMEPNISISLIGSMPPMLYSGYNQSLAFAIVNSGTGLARNITVTVSPSSNINLLGSIHKFFISALPSGNSVNENIFISANYTNSTKGYILLNVSYQSSNYKNSFSKSYNESLYLMPSAQFDIVKVASNAYPGATDVPVTYTIKNVGNEVAKQVQVSFQSIYPVTPINGNAYIAELLPGEEANVTFMINVDTSGLPGNYPVTIFETWKQPNGTPNQLYSGSNNYYIVVGNGSGNNSSLIWDIIIVVVIVLLATYFAAKQAKARKSKK
ncbi:MAG: CARDB domain-containing protein [Candidatus Micrarchaeota archaeon]